MLYSISWAAFLETILILTVLYYGAIIALYFRQELWAALKRKFGKV